MISTEIIVAVLGLIGTLFGSFLGVMASSRLTQYRIQKLEEKVDKHNTVIERTYVLEEQMKECMDEINELKGEVRS